MTRSTRSKDVVVGVGIVLFILYVVGAFGYAVYSSIVDPPSEFEEYDDDCPGPPYAVC